MKLEDVTRQLAENKVELIRAIYAGPDGITRGKAFRPAFLDEVLAGGIGLTQAQASVTVLDQLPRSSRFQPVGEVRMRPDLESFRVLPYLAGHARMLADLETLEGQPWELCPRSLLKRMVSDLSDRGMVLRATFENEFTMYSEVAGQWQPVDDLNCFSSAAMDIASEFILPMIHALEAQGVVVEKYFPEAGGGQQEIPVQHQEGVKAADQQVIFRETVRGVAIARGFRVSFMPKPDPRAAGNGCHIHFSLWDRETQTNLFYDASGTYQLSDTARQFAAGILAHLPALLALTAPTTNSYKRFVERCWSSCYVCWGPDNREATVRAASSFRGREEASLNLEYKPADPTCNPYLALAGVLCAGLDGLDRRLELGEPTLTDPALLSADERKAAGLTPYPRDLEAAVSALEADEVLRAGLSEIRIADYTTLKRAEIETLRSMGEDAEEKAYKFRF
jgi:glutamine synthetase